MVVGLLCTELGKTPGEVGRMRLPEVYRLMDYWAVRPPVQMMVAAYLGIDGKQRAPTAAMSQGGQTTSVRSTAGLPKMDVMQFLAFLGDGVKYGEGVQRPAPLPLPGVSPDTIGVPPPPPTDPGSRPATPPVEPPPGMVIRDG